MPGQPLSPAFTYRLLGASATFEFIAAIDIRGAVVDCDTRYGHGAAPDDALAALA